MALLVHTRFLTLAVARLIETRDMRLQALTQCTDTEPTRLNGRLQRMSDELRPRRNYPTANVNRHPDMKVPTLRSRAT